MSEHEYLVPFEILDAAVYDCLSKYPGSGWVEFERKQATATRIEYRLWLGQLGDLGKVTVKGGTNSTCLEIGAPPFPTGRDPTPEEQAEIESIADPDKKRRAGYALNAKIIQERQDLRRRRTERHRLGIHDLQFKLQDDPNLAQATPAGGSGGKMRGGRPRNKADDWAWQQIHELGRNRSEVYQDWLKRLREKDPQRLQELADPLDSFSKAVRPKRGEKRE